MAKGSYNISVSSDSNFSKERKISSEAELENQECMNSCLSSAFLRSLSFHDRPRSSRIPTDKELRKSQYKALVSSVERIPSNPLPPFEEKSEYNAYQGFESVASNEETEINAERPIYHASLSAAYQEIGQNQTSEPVIWLEDRYIRFPVESEKHLKKTIAILTAVDKDISESLTNLTKPESIALESIMEIYRNKGRSTGDSFADSELDLSTESTSRPVYENWQPSIQQKPKSSQFQSTRQSPKIVEAQSSEQSLKNEMKTLSTQQIPKNLQSQSSQESPKNLQVHFARQSPQNLQAQSSQESPKKFQVHSGQQTPKNLQTQSSQRSPKDLLVHSIRETIKNFQSPILNSKNTLSQTEPDWNNVASVEQSPISFPPAPETRVPNNKTKVKSLIEFDLPSDHEQFIKIICALQNRCLEYREMTQDIAVSALEECIHFSEPSIRRIRHLRRQFESQKRNFRDFKELCCKSVVFGPDSQPIHEKVTEVIQSFYLKLLQEENETFIARLECGLKMSEVYAKMLKLETESKKMITTLEKEILFLKKTSIGFKV